MEKRSFLRVCSQQWDTASKTQGKKGKGVISQVSQCHSPSVPQQCHPCPCQPFPGFTRALLILPAALADFLVAHEGQDTEQHHHTHSQGHCHPQGHRRECQGLALRGGREKHLDQHLGWELG